MSASTSPTYVPPRQPSGAGVRTALTGLAYVVQACVLLLTFVLGLGWGGLTYVAAVLQAILAFALIARLAARPTVLLVPVLSAALTAALAVADPAYVRATACRDEERAAAEQLAAPPGAVVKFEGNYHGGCLAISRMRLSKQAILEHYQAELARNGWQETAGRQDSTVGTSAEKNGLHLLLDINTEVEEIGGQSLEVVVGDSGSATPCQINTVNGYLERTPTTQVEPGNWAMLPSDTGQRGSVVIRDSTGTPIYDYETYAQPTDSDDYIGTDGEEGAMLTLALVEGGYQVECRPRGAAASTVPLRVAWPSPDSEQVNDVVLQIFETPEDWT